MGGIVFIWTLLFAFAAPASAQTSIKCNKNQTICELQATDMVTGDEIGLFNEHNQIVARGEVVKVDGTTRRIKITKRYGKIHSDFTYLVLNKKDRTRPKDFNIYKHPFMDQAGASLGIISLSFGSGGVGTEISGFYQKQMSEVPLLVRLAYVLASSEVAKSGTKFEAETTTLSVSGFGGLVGSSIIIWAYNKIGFRFEGAAGGFLASQSVSEGDIADYNTRFDDGFGFWLRGSAGLLYDMEPWQFTAEVAPQFIHEATGIAIVVGMAKAL